MEYASGGDMFEYVVRKGGLRESEARWFFQQLIIAIDYTHRVGVANRDIKLENTLLDGSPRPLIKICDFGYVLPFLLEPGGFWYFPFLWLCTYSVEFIEQFLLDRCVKRETISHVYVAGVCISNKELSSLNTIILQQV